MARSLARTPTIRVYGPDGVLEFEDDLDRPIVIGRLPGKDGLVIAEHDTSVSRKAVKVMAHDGRATISNTSSEAAIQVGGTRGIRYLDPGEELTIVQDTTAWIVGQGIRHRIEISGIRPPIRPQLKGNLTSRRFVSARPRAPRQAVLVALCLPRFEPDRFPKSTLTTKEIVSELAQLGTKITRREVDNKLQRMRISFSRRAGRTLSTRTLLAEYALARGIVTLADVKAFRSPTASPAPLGE